MVFDFSKGRLTYRKPNVDDAQAEKWQSFHFATRLKLEGATYFCGQLLGAASLHMNLGLPLLAHRQREWYLATFFFELCSAYDTLLQEINILYGYGLSRREVKWKAVVPKLPESLKEMMSRDRGVDWFKKVHWYRNTATHHQLIPMGESAGGWGEQTWDMDMHEAMIFYIDEQINEPREENITVCKEYLKKMLEHIHNAWSEMGQRFN